MEEINWFEIIVGIIEIIIATVSIYILNKTNSVWCVFFMLGGYHVAKGLYEKEDKQ